MGAASDITQTAARFAESIRTLPPLPATAHEILTCFGDEFIDADLSRLAVVAGFLFREDPCHLAVRSVRYLEPAQVPAARRILRAAAWTYVAASLASLLNLARWLAYLRRV